MLPALLLAALAASPSSPAERAAMINALGTDLGGCSAAEARAAVDTADISPLGTVNGARVVLASIHASCICGNVNCPYVVIRDDAHAAPLLETYAWDVSPVGHAQPLPNLRERAHDSALITIETIDAYRNGSYVAIEHARVRGDTGERKRDDVPVEFLPGASSAVLHGSVSPDWDDSYMLVADRGQQLIISGVHASHPVTFSGFAGPQHTPVTLTAGKPFVLPASGPVQLHIASDGSASYRATVTIR